MDKKEYWIKITMEDYEIILKAYGSISTIEGLFYPNLCPDLVTVPENVRLEVIRKYEDKLRPYLQ